MPDDGKCDFVVFVDIYHGDGVVMMEMLHPPLCHFYWYWFHSWQWQSVQSIGFCSFNGGNSTLGGCIGGSGAGGGAVKFCKSSATYGKALRVVSPDSKLVVVDEGGLVRIEMISMDDS